MLACAPCSRTRPPDGIPLVNTHILGVTSLWMGIPVFYGVLQSKDDAFLGLLSCTLAAVCAVSVVFWLDPLSFEDSILHRVKQLLSWAFAAELVCFSASNGLEPVGLFHLVMCVVLLCMTSNFLYQRELWSMQLLSRMLFRFAFYWWAHLLMVPPSRHEATAFMTLTLSYFSHALALYKGLYWKSTLLRKEQYWLSCAASLCWVALNARAHWGLNKL